MANKLLIVFVVFDVLFLFCAVIHLFIPLMTRESLLQPLNISNVATDLLLNNCPLTTSIVNAGIMFMTFLVSLPAILLKKNRGFLTAHSWGVTISALLTLIIGLEIWFSTLQTHANLVPIWARQSATTQSLLQEKFNCCGFNNQSLFVKDSTCANAATAARLGSCSTPFGVFANSFLDIVFTTFFGFVAVDVMLLLASLCLLKDRKEKERYRLIDEKSGYGGF